MARSLDLTLGKIFGGRAWSLVSQRRSLRWPLVAAVVSYFVIVHATLAFLIMRTDFRERFASWVPFTVTAPEFNMTYKRMAWSLARADRRARSGALLFIGDSIVRDLDTSSLARHTLNLAIPGDTTKRVHQRMIGYDSLKSARGVVLGVGINDQLYRSVPEAIEIYRKIIKAVPSDVPLIVQAVLPVDPNVAEAFDNRQVANLNAALEPLCASRPGCRFLEIGRALTDAKGDLAPAMHDGGGIHLSAKGGEVYWNAFNKAVYDHMPPARVIEPDGNVTYAR